MLLERKMVRILGRKEIPGRPLIYATTQHFLEVFGLNNIKDLPTPKEIESMGAKIPDIVEQPGTGEQQDTTEQTGGKKSLTNMPESNIDQNTYSGD